MKIDVLNWNEVLPNETRDAPKGRLFLRATQAVNVFVSLQGYEVLAGSGQEVDVTYSEEMTYRIEAPKGTRCYVYEPVRRVHTSEAEEVFTNIDRKPMESGNLLEVKKAMRQFQLMQFQAKQEAEQATREQIARLRAARPAPAEKLQQEEVADDPVKVEPDEKPQGE